ncbi:MAG: leucyl-tRNA synthetase [archaeon GW2011_AR19]|nr:MAG: leucyl-tRNA synthetase [archaeon GW2011_AR19]
MAEVNFKAIEKKWQDKWEEEEVFHVLDFVKDKKTPNGVTSSRSKYYVLEMFPYPSGDGLHMGHALNYTIGDIYARFKRMQGFNVLYPMGYDALGLPAENAAIKVNIHPENYTNKSISNFIKQQKLLGLSYDWSRMINTASPSYYQWDQWIFLKMLEKKIAYRKKAPVNWCSKCKSVLANEQVHDGKCWRHEDTKVEIKHLEQWFFKITNYADELLDKTDELDWPQRTKVMQKNWIGKSYGTEIIFKVNGKKWPIFTTRPDTIYGVTFMVVSAQHPELRELVSKEQKQKVEEFLKKLKSVSAYKGVSSNEEGKKELEFLEKEGVFTGNYAINPVNNEKIPIYAGNFVVADYGSGMVMAVPAHDQRDFKFAEKYGLKIKVVIEPKEYKIYERNGQISEAYTGQGNLIDSGEFSDLENEDAQKKITKFLIKKKLGREVVQYKLRDWLISRQRYWGAPIPIIYCDKCGAVPVPEKDLPIMLPKKVTFGEGNPLATNEEWIRTKCPKCKKEARRETDTMDTFVNSSWYFLRYCDPDNGKEIFDKEKVKYWMPIDQYIGGAEHACMHLIYCRFYTKFLRDLGLLDFDEPVKKLFHQGMLHGSDGHVMAKSRGNVINPLDVTTKYSTDSLRLALMSFASPNNDANWDEKVMIGSYKFLNKVIEIFDNLKIGDSDAKTESKLNKIIKEVTAQIENFKYNLAIIKIRELFNSLPEKTSKEVLEKSLKLLHPFCPHITEELWEKLEHKKFISLAEWPIAEEKKISEFFDKQDGALNKLVLDITNVLKIVAEKGRDASKVYLYVLPGEKDFYDLDELNKRIGKKVEIFEVSDKTKYDPKYVSKKAKSNRPAIYIE